MAYNTGNPLDSIDPRDVFDNATNLDRWANGYAPSYPDRFGITRKSFAGMEADFQSFLLASGYQDLGAYAAGLQITARNQIFLRSGEYYRAAASTTLPYTLTGTWATDAPFFVGVGDAVLRQDLGDLDALRTASYAARNRANLQAAYKKMRIDNLPVTIACQGDSMTGGYDVVSPDVVAGPDGATRAPVTYPDALQYLLRLYTGVDHVVINRGYGGDTAPMGRDRWTTDPGADVVHLMYGINDAGAGAFDAYISAMATIIKRHIDWGVGVVLHTTTLPGYGVLDPDSSRYSQALRTLAESYGCPVFESDTACRYANYPSVYSDWIHFNAHGYQKYGNAVGAFVLSGAWVHAPKMVGGSQFLYPGTGYEGIGFIKRGTALGGDWGSSYVDTGAGGLIDAANERISFTFFMDCEFMNVLGIGSFEGLDVELSYVTPATYVGDTRGNGSPNRFPVRSMFNHELRETVGYRVQPGRVSSAGRPAHMGVLIGRGWKTISVSAPSGFTGARYFQGLLLQEVPLAEAGRNNLAGPLETVAFGHSNVLIWQYPYESYADSTAAPAAASLPSSVYLPAPDAVMPAISGATGYYDSLPVEVDIQGSGAGEWAKVFLRRTGSGNTLTIESIATGASGAALVPTSAEVMYKAFDPNTRDLTGSYISGFGSAQENTFIRLGFGATSAGYYKILVRDSSKPGRGSLI